MSSNEKNLFFLGNLRFAKVATSAAASLASRLSSLFFSASLAFLCAGVSFALPAWDAILVSRMGDDDLDEAADCDETVDPV